MISGVSPETRRSRKFDTANQGDLKMPLYSNAIRDERVRDYLPVRRVMLAERDLLGWYAATDVPEYGVLEPSPEEITLS